ncbi:hypothetical protein HXX02_10615 [Microbulbifer elongatus]|uniref:Uncharacterized protein n=1 Tax=Microbulbifer elongatus TaxID=86173 RepID=A0ABT1P194_9GAMM|nr:hypothetical protein [Microbulbifer elongatus]MCQ3829897.1 hypothetical protein [Microbulbifer elongatus]
MARAETFLTVQISQRTLVSLIARRQLTAEQLRGLSPSTRRTLRRILLESLREQPSSGV